MFQLFDDDVFLFGKIFDSILYDKKISIGNVNFYRDLTHPKKIVDIALKTEEDCIIGSGELINVKNFIEDIFTKLDKKIINYIEYDESNNLNINRGGYYSCEKTSNYNELINNSKNDGKKISEIYDEITQDKFSYKCNLDNLKDNDNKYNLYNLNTKYNTFDNYSI